MARQGEADRHVPVAMPKHLVSSLDVSSTFKLLTVILVCWKAWSRKDTAQIDGAYVRLLVLYC